MDLPTILMVVYSISHEHLRTFEGSYFPKKNKKILKKNKKKYDTNVPVREQTTVPLVVFIVKMYRFCMYLFSTPRKRIVPPLFRIKVFVEHFQITKFLLFMNRFSLFMEYIIAYRFHIIFAIYMYIIAFFEKQVSSTKNKQKCKLSIYISWMNDKFAFRICTNYH